MFVPFVPHVTVINKTIVYSDTILPLKDIGSNLVVTKVSNVNEYDLEKCLTTIFKKNSQVTFNTIQYSREDKTIYFYTNKKINTTAYEESKREKYAPINSQEIILEEIKKILTSEDNNDYNCISLYDIAILLRKIYTEYDNMKQQFNNILNYYMEKYMEENFSEDSFIDLYNFDFENKLLHIGFQSYFDINDLNRDCTNIYFAKRNGDLYITKIEKASYPDKLYIDDVFNALSSKLSIMYDKFLTYTDYEDYRNDKDNIHPINSIFKVEISNSGVNLKLEKHLFKNDLELFASSDSNKCKIKCNSNIVIECIKGKENEIFKRIFVNISDCPIWCQKQLLEIRKEQLEMKQKQLDELKQRQEEMKQRQEEQIKYEEMKKQKRLTLIKKIFPFIKND